MYKQNTISYRKIIKEESIYLVLILGALLMGSWYSLYLKEKDVQSFRILYEWIKVYQVEVSLDLFLSNAFRYLKYLIVIWCFGWFGFTLPMSFIILFGALFAYGFTTASLVLLLGGKGLLIGVGIYGIQAMIKVSISILLIKRAVLLMHQDAKLLRQSYLMWGIGSLLVAVLLAGLDCLLGLLLNGFI